MVAAILIALALLIVAAAPAGATYPGRNGDLLVTERSHSHAFDDASHLLRIDPASGALTRTEICAQTLVFGFAGPWCNFAGPPAASPDGRWVAFAASDILKGPPNDLPAAGPWSVRVLPLDTGERRHIILDGWKLPYEDLVRWTPSLDFAVQAEGRKVLLAGQDGSDRGTFAARAAAPDVSSGGRLAFVRGGNLYVLKPGGKARRLTRKGANQPSWSPRGRRIAFTRKDWIYAVSAHGDRAQKLTRGFHPAWSPDGRQIAFFREVRNPAYGQKTTHLFVLDLRTGRVRRVTSEVLAVSDGFQPNGLDWQALR